MFEKQAKHLTKKYPSLKNQLKNLVLDLRSNPIQGTSLGNHCYKLRMAITSKNKGKSGESRIIINVVVEEKNVYLLTIYDKSEKANITQVELNQLLKYIPS